MDAPAHMLENGKTLDQYPVCHFTGKALIISVPGNLSLIGMNLLLPFEHEIASMDFVLFRTGWSKYWGKPEYFKGFPTLAHDTTDRLLAFSLRGIGFDTISADTAESKDYPNHIRIFENNLIIIENLVFPDALTESSGIFSCFPLPLENADGSPVRAVLSV